MGGDGCQITVVVNISVNPDEENIHEEQSDVIIKPGLGDKNRLEILLR